MELKKFLIEQKGFQETRIEGGIKRLNASLGRSTVAEQAQKEAEMVVENFQVGLLLKDAKNQA